MVWRRERAGLDGNGPTYVSQDSYHVLVADCGMGSGVQSHRKWSSLTESGLRLPLIALNLVPCPGRRQPVGGGGGRQMPDAPGGGLRISVRTGLHIHEPRPWSGGRLAVQPRAQAFTGALDDGSSGAPETSVTSPGSGMRSP